MKIDDKAIDASVLVGIARYARPRLAESEITIGPIGMGKFAVRLSASNQGEYRETLL